MNLDNIIMLTGRLTADPELKSTQSGVSVCTFTIAVDRDYKDSSGNKQTDFISCTAWRKTAEFITQYFNKGSKIKVGGSLEMQSWKDQNGNNRISPNVLVEKAGFAESKKEAQPNNPYTNPVQFEEITEDETLPF